MSKAENKRVRALMSYLGENRWTVVIIALAVVMVISICRNLVHALRIRYEIAILEGDKSRFQESITKDSTLIESLKYDVELERYAREKYHMQRADEEIFIIK